jgi:hypothetical protein
VLRIGRIRLDARGRDQGWRIDDFELVVGEANDTKSG